MVGFILQCGGVTGKDRTCESFRTAALRQI